MSKTVVLSFDDGREDTYTNAWPILKQYGLRGTINVVTDFIRYPERYQEFSSAAIRALVEKGTLSYIRTGIQVRREGLRYAGLTAWRTGRA